MLSRPVAVIISGPEGVRVEPIKGGAASLLEKVADVAGRFVPAKPAAG